jgi:hypothetical protein
MSINNYEAGTREMPTGYDNYKAYDPTWPRESETTFTCEKLVEKLNKETLPWDDHKYRISLNLDWRWDTDTVPPTAIMLTLYKDDESIGLLNIPEGIAWTDFTVLGIQLYGNATVEDVRFLRECTGWIINV